jgi:peptidyl-prolyl cis-trans isomerase D
MSVIQSIRDRGTWIIFILLGLALIAFILQDGLGKQGSVFSNNSTLGKVNGVTIDRAEFEKKVELYSRGNAAQYEQTRTQLWDQEINKVLLEEEFEALGLGFSDKQLNEELYKPGSQLMQQFTDPKTGFPNVDQAKQVLAQIKKSKKAEELKQVAELVNVTRLQTLNNKYNAILSQSAYVPKWLVEKQLSDNNSIANVSYVAVPYNTIADSTVKVSDDEIVAYGNKHAKQYEKDEETRIIKFVSFDAQPSKSDSQATYAKLLTYKQTLETTADAESFFAKNNSSLPYFNGYISKSQINQPVKDSLFKLSVGQTYGPYIDGNNYVVAKMVGIKAMPDSAKVRHILFKTKDRDPQTGQSFMVRDDSTAKHLADTVMMDIAKGKSFDSLCLAKSEDEGSKDKKGIYDYFPSGRMVASFNEFCFGKPVGSKGIVQTEFGYHYIEVLGQKGSQTAYNIAYMAKPITVSNETDVNVKNQASTFIAKAGSGKSFDEAITKDKMNAITSGEFKKVDAMVPSLGNNRNLVRWAYESSVGDVTKSYFDVNNKYVVAMLVAINKVGVPSATTLRPLVENLIRNEKKAKQIIETKFKGNTLEAFATSTGTVVQKLDSLQFSQPFIPALGNAEPKFIGAAFNASNKGKVTEPIAGNGGVFVLKTDLIGAKPSTLTIDVLKQQLLQSVKGSASNISAGLRKAATIKDNRGDFY